MIFTSKFENLLGVSGFGEGGVAAQSAEHDDDLAAMAFEDLLVALRDDQLSKLRREKALQPSDAAQFLNLLGDACFKPTVQLRHLVGALTQFTQKAGILHRD